MRDRRLAELLRKRIRIDASQANGMIFKVADTMEELEAAYGLVHDVYVQKGYMDPDPSEKRVTPHHAAPGTATFICRISGGGGVVLTMTLFPDSNLGLPMDSEYHQELEAFREKGRFIGEAGCLASNPAYWNNSHTLLLCTIKMVHTYNTKYLKLHDLVIAVNPKHVWFYEHVMLMKHIGAKKPYKDVKGAPAIAMRLDLKTMEADFRGIYGGSPDSGNLYEFFFKKDSPAIVFPEDRV